MTEAEKSSEEVDTLVCNPCKHDGKNRTVYGFCDTCKEHLCVDCFKSHRVPLLMRTHVLLDEADMPKEKVVPRDPLTEQCEKHGRLLEYYCKKHDEILCTVCVTLNHVNCGVSFIPDESNDVGNSREFSQLRANVSDFIERVKKNNKKNVGKKADIEKLREDTMSQVKQMKKEFVQFFDNLELLLVLEIDQLAETDYLRMEEVSKNYVNIEADLRKLAENLDEKFDRNQNNKLFVAMKNAEKKMADFQSRIESNDSKNRVTWYRFEPDLDLERLKLSVKALGMLHVPSCHGNNVKATHERNLNVCNDADRYECLITGIASISRDLIAVCDGDNCSVKLIDTKNDNVKSSISLTSPPWDTALLPRDITLEQALRDLIVTLPEVGKLHYVRVVGDQLIDTHKDISVEGQCRGIDVTRDRKLVVSFHGMPGKVEILEMDGRLLRKIDTDNNGDLLFLGPEYLAVSPCHKMIFVSDFRENKLTSVRIIDGRAKPVLWGLDTPRGVAANNAGSMFVCCHDRSVRQMVATTGDHIRQILGEEDGLCRDPRAIALSPEEDMLYVSGYGTHYVQAFRLT